MVQLCNKLTENVSKLSMSVPNVIDRLGLNELQLKKNNPNCQCYTLYLKILLFSISFRHGEPDFLYARSWIPFYFFSGVVTFGSIGRQLAMVNIN